MMIRAGRPFTFFPPFASAVVEVLFLAFRLRFALSALVESSVIFFIRCRDETDAATVFDLLFELRRAFAAALPAGAPSSAWNVADVISPAYAL
jgi:hypothetical protein